MDENRKRVLVVLVMLLGIGGLLGGILYLREYRFGQQFYNLNVSFSNIGTLIVGDPVRISGVKVGRVRKIELRRKDVLVVLEVDQKYLVPKDSRIIIQSVGIMGERMVAILLGAMDEKMNEAETYRGEYEIGIGEALGSVGILVDKVDTLLREVRSVMDSTVRKETFAKNFNASVENLAVVSGDVRELLDDNKATITRTINKTYTTLDDVRQLVKRLDNTIEKIDPVISSVDTVSREAIELIADVRELTYRAESIVGKIESGEGTMGKLISEDDLYNELLNTLSAVDSLSGLLLEHGIRVRLFRWQR